MRSRTRWIALLAVAGLLASACGETDPAEPEGTDAATEEATDATDAATDETTEDAATDEATEEPAATGTWAGEGGGDDGVLQVAFVYVGPIGDAGWTYAHDLGRLAMEDALGDQVETTYIESVEEGAPSERIFEDLAREGYELIFGTSFGYMEPMATVAPDFPETVFEHCSGYTTGENLGTYFGAMEEPRYLSGMAAAAASETGRIGYVAAFPIAEVIRGINAFTLGVREVDPEATVEVVWTSTWYDPAAEKEAAESLLDQGVDVVSQHQDTPAPGQAAEERDAFWVGYNSDMSEFAPEAWLTAPTWDWGPYYIETVEAVLDGTWTSREVYGTMAEGMVGLAPYGPGVDEDTQALIDERRQEIEDGSFVPFTGPLNDQDGELRVEEGVEMTLPELLDFDWFVEGVVGTLG